MDRQAPRWLVIAEPLHTAVQKGTDRDVEAALMHLLDFEHFDLVRELLKNRHTIVWCTRLQRAQADDERQRIEASSAALRTQNATALLQCRSLLRATRVRGLQLALARHSVGKKRMQPCPETQRLMTGSHEVKQVKKHVSVLRRLRWRAAQSWRPSWRCSTPRAPARASARARLSARSEQRRASSGRATLQVRRLFSFSLLVLLMTTQRRLHMALFAHIPSQKVYRCRPISSPSPATLLSSIQWQLWSADAGQDMNGAATQGRLQVDLESLAFSEEGHFMSNRKVNLPPGSQRNSFKVLSPAH